MKISKKLWIATLAVCLVPLIAGAILYSRLPEQVVTHWGINGEPNGSSSRLFAAFGLPLFMAAMQCLLLFVLSTDPKKKNMDPKLVSVAFWIVPVLSVLVSALTLCYAMGVKVSVERIAPALVGILFIVLGNYLPKTKQSYTMGIRLPWTLNSEENWNRTHRLAGFLWVAGGILFLIFTILGWWNIYVLLILIIVMSLVPTVYSYLLYRKGI